MIVRNCILNKKTDIGWYRFLNSMHKPKMGFLSVT